jgi:hypothetical protein
VPFLVREELARIEIKVIILSYLNFAPKLADHGYSSTKKREAPFDLYGGLGFDPI